MSQSTPEIELPLFGLTIGDSGSAQFLQPPGGKNVIIPLFTSTVKSDEFLRTTSLPCMVKHLSTVAAVRRFVTSPPALGKPGPSVATDVVLDRLPGTSSGTWYTLKAFEIALDQLLSPAAIAKRLAFPLYVIGNSTALALMDHGDDDVILPVLASKENAIRFAVRTGLREDVVRPTNSATELLQLMEWTGLGDEVEIWTDEEPHFTSSLEFHGRYPLREFRQALETIAAYEVRRESN